jgi:hypothetical protein
MHIHGGGLATSEQSNQNGWSKTFKVHNIFSLYHIIKLLQVHALVLTLYINIYYIVYSICFIFIIKFNILLRGLRKM